MVLNRKVIEPVVDVFDIMGCHVNFGGIKSASRSRAPEKEITLRVASSCRVGVGQEKEKRERFQVQSPGTPEAEGSPRMAENFPFGI